MPAFATRKYNTATSGGSNVRMSILKAGSTDFATSSDWTPASGDVKVSIDDAAEANINTLPTYTNGKWVFTFTAGELLGKSIHVRIVDQGTKVIADDYIVIETFGNASAQFPPDFGDSVRQGMTALPNANAAASGGLLVYGTGTGGINPSGGYVPTLSGAIANQNFSALYAGTPQTWTARISASNTNLDGKGSITKIVEGGPKGTRIDLVKIVAQGTTTAGFVRLWISDGPDWALLAEVPVSAITPSSSVAVFTYDWVLSSAYPFLLEKGAKLGASTHNAESFAITACGSNF